MPDNKKIRNFISRFVTEFGWYWGEDLCLIHIQLFTLYLPDIFYLFTIGILKFRFSIWIELKY